MKNLYLDDVPHPMILSDGSGYNGFYQYVTTAAVGEHGYYFHFSDGNGASVKFPESGDRYGPLVTLPPPPPLPESEHPYANNFDFTWSYTLEGDPTAIDVVFESGTFVEVNFDSIHITDSDGNKVPGSPFTGSSLSGKEITVPGDTVNVRLVTDQSVTGWGFNITSIEAHSNSTPVPVPLPTEELPESSHPYNNLADTLWSYTLSGNPTGIAVNFAPQTFVETGYDVIHVMDAAGVPVSGSPFTGSELAGQTLPVSGSTVLIRLVSDDIITGWGFKVIDVQPHVGAVP